MSGLRQKDVPDSERFNSGERIKDLVTTRSGRASAAEEGKWENAKRFRSQPEEKLKARQKGKMGNLGDSRNRHGSHFYAINKLGLIPFERKDGFQMVQCTQKKENVWGGGIYIRGAKFPNLSSKPWWEPLVTHRTVLRVIRDHARNNGRKKNCG